MEYLGDCPKCGKALINACPICHQPAELYSRIVGYLRPVQLWNSGKQREFIERKTFVISQGDHLD